MSEGTRSHVSPGSLVARIIFQPLEETLLLHFTSSLHTPTTAPLLIFILHISSHLLLLLPAFLPPLLPALLPLLLPRRYLHTSAPSTLETYLKFYLPLLSLNGILEAFHASSAIPDQVAKQARWMIGSSAVFAVSLYMFTQLFGATLHTEQGLIYASCLAMIVRIGYAYGHAAAFFADRKEGMRISRIVPRRSVTISSILSGVVLRTLARTERWEKSWRGWAELVGAGGVMGLGVLAIMCVVAFGLSFMLTPWATRWRVERQGLNELRRVTRGGKID